MCEPAAKPQHASSVAADVSTSSSRTTVRMNRSAIADSEPRRGAAAIVALTGAAQFRTIRRRPKTPPEDSTACRGRRQATDARSARLAAVPPNRTIVIIAKERWGELAQSPAHPGQPEGVAGLGGHHSSTPNVDRRRFYTVSSTLRMSRYGPLYPRSRSTPALRP